MVRSIFWLVVYVALLVCLFGVWFGLPAYLIYRGGPEWAVAVGWVSVVCLVGRILPKRRR